MAKDKHKEGKKPEKLIERVKTLEDQLSRAVADYRNLESRIQKEASFFKTNLSAGLIDKLLAVLEDLQRAQAHLKDKGLSMAVKQFKDILKNEGVEEVKSSGQLFNPETMDCVSVEAGPQNVVVETVCRGYTLNGRLVRPAKVKVGKGKK